jgi:diguanylate cyclase (GGDEF)-like protein/PAS domain S-box-containing protein
MSGGRPLVRDWRAWAFVASTVALGVGDMLLPSSIVILPFMVVPIVGASALGRPALPVVVWAVSQVLASISSRLHDYPMTDTVRRSLVLLLSTVVAVLIARMVRATQNRLRSGRSAYKLLADNASDVVYVAGADGKITWASPNTSTTLGWAPEDLLATSMFERLHPDDQEALSGVREALLAGQQVESPPGGYVVRVRSKDGHWLWMSLRATFMRDAGSWTAIVGMRDVSDLVEARRAAEADEELIRINMEAVLDPLALLSADRDAAGAVVDFTFAWVNQSACDHLGRTMDELIGSRLLDIMSGPHDTGLFVACARAVGSEVPVITDDFRHENHLLGVRYFDIRARAVPGDRLSLTWRDVTERHESARRVAESEERFRLIAENSTDVVLQMRDSVLVWLSPALTGALGWAPEEWLGHQFEEFTHPDDVALAQRRRVEMEAGETRITTLRMRDKAGAYHWVEVHGGPFTDADGHVDGIVASFRVTDSEVAAQEALERRAKFDELTGVLKRDEALLRLSRISGHVRRTGHESAVLFCDLDHFKDVNDTHGHAAGDEVLRVIARRIRGCVRAGDTVARMGGDEFLVVLDGIHDLLEAAGIAEKMRTAAAVPVEIPGGFVTTTLSIGVTLSGPDEDIDSMIARADQAMYDAKDAGRDKVITIAAE